MGEILYLRTAEEVRPIKGGAVVACVGKIDLGDASDAIDSGDKGELEDLRQLGLVTWCRLIEESNINVGV
jgi:hypothetical protein